jgi:hypothetical protein
MFKHVKKAHQAASAWVNGKIVPIFKLLQNTFMSCLKFDGLWYSKIKFP